MKKTSIITICLLLFGAMATQAQQLSAFKADNGKWGYRDQDQNTVIEPKYDETRSFYEGLAMVEIGKLRGFINMDGKPSSRSNTKKFPSSPNPLQRSDKIAKGDISTPKEKSSSRQYMILPTISPIREKHL